MTRLDFEKDILRQMGLVDLSDTVVASLPIRLFIQTRINSALESLWNENTWSFRRKTFGGLLKAPVTTGTISIVQGAQTGTLTGVTPDSTWLGGHVIISANGFPLRVEGVSGQILTFAEAIVAPTTATSGYKMCFDSLLLPVDCQKIAERTMKLAGHRKLVYIDRPSLEFYQGYFREDTDYGFIAYATNVVKNPDIAQPIVYNSWGSYVVSGITRRALSFYPYPDGMYSISFDGWKKVTPLAADADVPEIPEQFHRSVLLPRVVLEMCGYPGFELSAQEKQAYAQIYADGLVKMNNECRQDENEVTRFMASKLCL